MYRQRDGYWKGFWIVEPPGADFDDCYAFNGPRAFDNAVHYANQQVSIQMINEIAS